MLMMRSLFKTTKFFRKKNERERERNCIEWYSCPIISVIVGIPWVQFMCKTTTVRVATLFFIFDGGCLSFCFAVLQGSMSPQRNRKCQRLTRRHVSFCCYLPLHSAVIHNEIHIHNIEMFAWHTPVWNVSNRSCDAVWQTQVHNTTFVPWWASKWQWKSFISLCLSANMNKCWPFLRELYVGMKGRFLLHWW